MMGPAEGFGLPYNRLMRAKELLREAAHILKQAKMDEPGAEAMALVREIAGVSAAEYYAYNPEVSPDKADAVITAALRRAWHEPVQYITGTVEFMGLPLRVGPGVLVPRPETELLVAEFYERFHDTGAKLQVLDLCTGSGCIALAIAARYPNLQVTATDASPDALEYARENLISLKLDNVSLLEGSLYEPVEEGAGFDAIVSNPPYIPAGEIEGLMPEVSRYEPHSALDGGEDGLDFYRLIIKGAGQRLKPGGLIFFELGAGQAEDVSAIAEAGGLSVEKVIKDFTGHGRVIVLGA